jgi:hypothetical protein
MNLVVIVCEDLRINLVQDGVQWRTVRGNTVMNLWVP